MAMKASTARGGTKSEIARLLQVSEEAVRYHLRRLEAGASDGRARQVFKAQAYAAEIASWREQQAGRINLAALHDWLGEEHGYDGSLKSVQRYWARTYSTPQVRARRQVETPPSAQAPADLTYFWAGEWTRAILPFFRAGQVPSSCSRLLRMTHMCCRIAWL